MSGSARPHLNLVINWLLDGNADGNGENPPVYWNWTIDDPHIKKVKSLSAWISRFVNLKKTGYSATLKRIAVRVKHSTRKIIYGRVRQFLTPKCAECTTMDKLSRLNDT